MAIKKAKPKSSTPKPPRGANQTGAGYMKKTYNSAAGDLSGRGRMLNAKDEFFAYPVYADNGRTSQRAKDQTKRKAASMGKNAASKFNNAKKVSKGKK